MADFKTDINLGELVYLLTDQEQEPRMVIAFEFTIDGGLLIKTVCGTRCCSHYRAELSKQKNIELALGIQNN